MLLIERIDPAMGYYIAGFVDGEGSFNVKFRPRPEFRTGWKVSLTFNVSHKDEVILALIKKQLGCGTIFHKGGGVWMLEVSNIDALAATIVPFFKRFGFHSGKKKRDFSIFAQMVEMILDNRHLTAEGIVDLLRLRRNMNDGGKRKYSEEEILSSLKKV